MEAKIFHNFALLRFYNAFTFITSGGKKVIGACTCLDGSLFAVLGALSHPNLEIFHVPEYDAFYIALAEAILQKPTIIRIDKIAISRPLRQAKIASS
ncbi:hypothetical protein ACRBEV_05555 [Methylobacterium phyllosphaerae]